MTRLFVALLIVVAFFVQTTEGKGGFTQHHSTATPFAKRQSKKSESEKQSQENRQKDVYKKVAKTASPKQTNESGYPLKKACCWYLNECADNPLRTKSYTAALINIIGDILAQHLEAYINGEPVLLDSKGTTTFSLCGLCFVGPFVHAWYELLLRLAMALENRFQASKLRQVVAQILADQTLGVALYFPSYFYSFEVLESLVLRKMPSMSTA